jgi:putative toxin-antitoxin system antitoxin component (TIGR02293 family)
MSAVAGSRYEGVLESLGRPAAADTAMESALDVHRMLEAGISGTAIRALASHYGLSNEDLTRLLGVPLRTLQRREKQYRLPPGDTDRLWRAALVLHEAARILGSPDKARRWLHRENRALGGLQPIEMLATEAGYEEVRNILGRIEWGVWS